ncbi:MAG: hypothetical protein OXI27_08770 [Thaumarchaeota archaeon]|nr:hypothetical protein [Nitrososphaerota archaeon]MDE0526667.1 hypothetical protein [Nitrososphaerota archaeon]
MIGQHNSKTVYEILGRNSVHPFPARMAPGIALDVVADCQRPLRILDPMSGSGTVLAIAQARGHHAIGIDTDPLAVLISRVWTTAVSPAVLMGEAAAVLERARRAFAHLRTRDAYPRNSDEETRRFVRFWFDDYVRRQLRALADSIADVDDKKIRNALWCAFSRLIITKQSGASLAMDLSHSRPHKVFSRAPLKPFSKFMFAAGRVADGCSDDKSRGSTPPAQVHEGDARMIPLEDGSVDLILTSPPYLNAIDYLRCSKFSLIWMGYTVKEIRRIRSTSIGTLVGKYGDAYAQDIMSRIHLQPALRPSQEMVLARYVDDMRRVICEIARVLVDGGKATYVIGENTVHGTFIPNSRIVEEVASDIGLRCEDRRSRELPTNRRYLPPPSGQATALDGRMRREVMLTLAKA